MQDKDEQKVKNQGLARFEPGGDLGPIESRQDFENRVNTLPIEQKELTEQLSRFADVCQYFDREKMGVPADIVEELNRASRLPILQRIEAVKKLNQRLMESLPDVGDDPRIRQ